MKLEVNENKLMNDSMRVVLVKDVRLEDENFNNQSRTVLGILKGKLAICFHGDRGIGTEDDGYGLRYFSKELWNIIFENEIVKTEFDHGGILGELNPDFSEDRDEVLLREVAIKLCEKPKLGDDGELYAEFEILNTPQGQIVYTLAKSGCIFWISSRIIDTNTDEIGEFNDTYVIESVDIMTTPLKIAAKKQKKCNKKTFDVEIY